MIAADYEDAIDANALRGESAFKMWFDATLSRAATRARNRRFGGWTIWLTRARCCGWAGRDMNLPTGRQVRTFGQMSQHDRRRRLDQRLQPSPADLD
jgi:hypothetical protein